MSTQAAVANSACARSFNCARCIFSVAVSGNANQVIDIPGGRVVINEQSASAGGISVNALHVIVDGIADVVVGSATAALR